ncbi:MFS transporter, MHS family, alpha-ketoglutaratepermease [Bartonella sp. CDC_skunk]|uniref:Alpha-ketoglutarate permease n=1 Tax=Bartonella rochalimae ATCC BAA-1498 TaxID=685782 RepID=E6YMJ2_9HYPH|nr:MULTISPECIES: MFS family transporter [Bartonella]AQX18147.1 MFS transporter, MHS family, alpha-ketoglutaratepermease [Bartonella sp. A1379B]AQX21078.1 MFS transporter, MHS family, alpha-ketoglutaratepermease [Bartonella sp. CDC_skunk]AQX22661.1 MFS transporter, MHS family, alpha-ketoglutaratepermease [Bartonella sp. 11B]AQX24055.1 MFS transporter, MHS family, alpha-ketoglutaratepermease [Bartonella sp. 114]AQX25110.1 MFS transporter, MHS family, alpha-ketoglutaratepermease [Bartonella sp. C
MENEETLALYDAKKRIRSIISSASGNLVEWYDFYVYSFTSIYFASQFFPSDGNVILQLFKAAIVFSIGFLMRPIGGWLFGFIADRYGRKRSMLISVFMMCSGSFLIAILPTYETIGASAAVLLLLLRMLQGLSVGGEYGTTATYMSEIALKNRRGFFSSFQYTTLIGGQLLASLVIFILALYLTEEQLKAWGWRIPFAIGGLGAIVAIYLRRSLHETTTKENRSKEKAGSIRELWRNHRKAFFLVIGFTAGGSLTFYTYTTYMQKYLITTTGFDKHTATTIMTIALFVFMLLQPAFGALADKIGTKTSLIIWSVLSVIFTIPGLYMIGNTNNSWVALSILIGMLCIISFYTSISGIVKAEMFPSSIRAMGVGLSYAIANALFGGSAESVALLLKDIGYEFIFYLYVTGMMTVAFIAVLLMPDARKSGYLQGDDIH